MNLGGSDVMSSAKSKIPYDDDVLGLISCPDLRCDIDLRPYQHEAPDRWRVDHRGLLVLPMVSGKTYLGMMAIQRVNAPAVVIVPSLDLVDQWREELQQFHVPIGDYTGRAKQLEAIILATPRLRLQPRSEHRKPIQATHLQRSAPPRFRGVPTHRRIVCRPVPHALDRTYERENDKREKLSRLLGGKVYEIDTDELTGEYLIGVHPRTHQHRSHAGRAGAIRREGRNV